MRFRVAMLLSILMVQASAPAGAPPDFSTPRAAAKSFYNAVEAGDVPTIRAAMLADDDAQKKLIDAFADVIGASRKLAGAARDKFGAAGDLMQMSALPKEEAARIDKADEKIDGPGATLTIPGRPLPMKFRKGPDGSWKLIVTEFAGATPSNIGPQTELLRQLAQILSDTAADVSAGKFATSDEAQSAFEQKFNAAMIEAARPATAPAAPSR